MSETQRQFRVARRGYDPAEVDAVVHQLTTGAEAARRRAEQLEARVRELEESGAAEAPAEAVSFAHLGERVGQILSLADEEAHDVLARARAEAEQAHAEAGAAAQAIRDDADHYARQRRSEADAEAARILEDAKRAADDRIDTADRDAAARLQEAEAVYENQRAQAAKAAADFETTLAHRRKLAEEEFAVQMEESRARLEDIERQVERSRAEADAERAEATRQAQQLVQDAQQQAESLVSSAKTTASRVRADSERELAAASQRRDAINSQLANVRQMLTTLTGSSPAALADLPDGGEPPAETPVAADHDEPAEPDAGDDALTEQDDEQDEQRL